MIQPRLSSFLVGSGRKLRPILRAPIHAGLAFGLLYADELPGPIGWRQFDSRADT